MKTRLAAKITAALLSLGLPASTQAGDFHFPLGITYAEGIYDVGKKLDDLYTQAGYDFDRNVVIPVGLTFSPYYEFDFGLGVGVHAGPASIIVVDTTTVGGGFSSSDTDVSYVVPVGADLRYTFFQKKNISPYVRGGVRYPIVGGPNFDSSSAGPFGAIGIDFWRNKAVGLGIEVGYDDSKVKVEGPNGRTREVTFAGFTAGLNILF